MNATSSGAGSFCSNETKHLIVHLYHNWVDAPEPESEGEDDELEGERTRRPTMTRDKQLQLIRLKDTLRTVYGVTSDKIKLTLYHNAVRKGICEPAQSVAEMKRQIKNFKQIFKRRKETEREEERRKTWITSSYKTHLNKTAYPHLEEMVVTLLRNHLAPSVPYSPEMAHVICQACMDLLGDDYRRAYMLQSVPNPAWLRRAFNAGSYNKRMIPVRGVRDVKDEFAAIDCLDDTWGTIGKYPKNRIFYAEKITLEMLVGNFDVWMCCNGDGSIKVSPWMFLASIFTEFEQTLQDYYNPDLTDEERTKLEATADEETKMLKQKVDAADKRRKEAALKVEETQKKLKRVDSTSEEGGELQEEFEVFQEALETTTKGWEKAKKAYQNGRERVRQRLITEGKPSPFQNEDGEFIFDRRLKLPVLKTAPEGLGTLREMVEDMKACKEEEELALYYLDTAMLYRDVSDDDDVKDLTGPEMVMDFRCVEQENGEMDTRTLVHWLRKFAIESGASEESPALLVLDNIGFYNTAVRIVKSIPDIWLEMKHVEVVFLPAGSAPYTTPMGSIFVKEIRRLFIKHKRMFQGRIRPLSERDDVMLSHKLNWLLRAWADLKPDMITKSFSQSPLFYFHDGFPLPEVAESNKSVEMNETLKQGISLPQRSPCHQDTEMIGSGRHEDVVTPDTVRADLRKLTTKDLFTPGEDALKEDVARQTKKMSDPKHLSRLERHRRLQRNRMALRQGRRVEGDMGIESDSSSSDSDDSDGEVEVDSNIIYEEAMMVEDENGMMVFDPNYVPRVRGGGGSRVPKEPAAPVESVESVEPVEPVEPEEAEEVEELDALTEAAELDAPAEAAESTDPLTSHTPLPPQYDYDYVRRNKKYDFVNGQDKFIFVDPSQPRQARRYEPPRSQPTSSSSITTSPSPHTFGTSRPHAIRANVTLLKSMTQPGATLRAHNAGTEVIYGAQTTQDSREAHGRSHESGPPWSQEQSTPQTPGPSNLREEFHSAAGDELIQSPAQQSSAQLFTSPMSLAATEKASDRAGEPTTADSIVVIESDDDANDRTLAEEPGVQAEMHEQVDASPSMTRRDKQSAALSDKFRFMPPVTPKDVVSQSHVNVPQAVYEKLLNPSVDEIREMAARHGLVVFTREEASRLQQQQRPVQPPPMPPRSPVQPYAVHPCVPSQLPPGPHAPPPWYYGPPPGHYGPPPTLSFRPPPGAGLPFRPPLQEVHPPQTEEPKRKRTWKRKFEIVHFDSSIQKAHRKRRSTVTPESEEEVTEEVANEDQR